MRSETTVRHESTRCRPRRSGGVGRTAASAALVALVLAGCGDAGPAPSTPAEPPNIVLIVMDTTAAAHLSTYGYERPTTPNLDRLAAESALFLNAFSSAPWTLPSHASIFTGLYPAQHWATYEHPKLEPVHRTLASILKEQGYRTVGVSNAGWVAEHSGLSAGFETFVKVSAWDKTKKGYRLTTLRQTPDGPKTTKGQFPWEPDMDDSGARRTNRMVAELLDEAPDDDRPLFLFLNFVEAHLPYEPPPEFARKFLRDGVTVEQARAIVPNAYAHNSGADVLSPEELSILTDLYDAEIACLDERLAELFEDLTARGILDDALLVITADHGEQIGHHGFLGHNLNIYDELLHVPLIVRYPGRYDGGRRIEMPVQTLDIFATALSLAAPDFEPPADSRVLPTDDGARPDRVLVSEYSRPIPRLKAHLKQWPDRDVSHFDRRLKAVRVGDWKLIAGSDGSRELYDTTRDPDETDDLAAEQAALTEELAGRLDAWVDAKLSDTGAALQDGVLHDMDPEVQQELRELGYIR